MLALITKALFLSVFATIVACIEIEAEGKMGWAEKMPTWYRTTGFWARLYGKAMGGKPLTGYHAFMFVMPIMVFHLHFFMGVPWSMKAELIAWALYVVWGVMWDYHWFVLNPAYVGKFKQSHVWWHAQSPWIGGLFPLDYLVGILVSVGLAGAAALVSDSWTMLVEHFELLAGFGLYTALLHLAAPVYGRWYKQMRLTDDRDKAPIFHKEDSH